MQELDYRMIGSRIRQFRKAKGWLQDELAKKAGISVSFVGHIERGSRIMSLETLVNICSALEIGADVLLWGGAHPSDSVLGMWELSDKSRDGKQDGRRKEKSSDSYAMYVRIMKSVAEIMNEP